MLSAARIFWNESMTKTLDDVQLILVFILSQIRQHFLTFL